MPGIQLFRLVSYIVQIIKYIRVYVPHRVAHTDVLYWFVGSCYWQGQVPGIQLFTLVSYIVQIIKYIPVDVPHRVAHTDVLYWFVDSCYL